MGAGSIHPESFQYRRTNGLILVNVSEDIRKTGVDFAKTGLISYATPAREDKYLVTCSLGNPSRWHRLCNIVEERLQQDVGFDGVQGLFEAKNSAVISEFFGANFGTGAVYQKLVADPSSDNHRHFRDELYTMQVRVYSGRYKDFNNPQE